MMMRSTTDVGLDTSKKSIQVAMLVAGRREAVEWEIANEPGAVKRLARRLRASGGRVAGVLRSGPVRLHAAAPTASGGREAIVVAPSLVAVKPGQRIKTNRRDARKLAQALHADGLTEVHPPTLEEEAVRDLSCCREDAREDLLRARHRLAEMLLRRGLVYGAKAWTDAHRRWLRSLDLEHEADRAVFGDYLQAIEHLEQRLRALEEKLVALSEKEPYREPVGWLRCLRGIDTVTAMTLVTELHDFRRFESPRALMAYLGLVPSENSTGREPSTRRDHQGRKQARTTGAFEASWHYRHRPAVGRGFASAARGSRVG